MGRLQSIRERVSAFTLFPCDGRVCKVSSGEIEAAGPPARVGAFCEILDARTREPKLLGEVVALDGARLHIVPLGAASAAEVDDLVRLVPGAGHGLAGDAFASRAIDALGRPLDGRAPPAGIPYVPAGVGVLGRVTPSEQLTTGLRAVDGFLTIGRGQRVGVFAASGVGKSRLVEQVIAQARCDRIVVCLVGERGREVEALWREAGERITIVAATLDEPAPLRARSVDFALGLAEYWREAGEDVLLVVDSITRLAMALREIGLAAGEPPTVRAYTPNVLRELPRIVERCGAVRNSGSITAIFTVLSETDDVDDPIVEVMKSLLDGHIVLSRSLAQAGHFPAIDIGASISRLFGELVDPEHARAARTLRAQLARYEESRLLIESGLYKAGSNPALDRAIALRERINALLVQSTDEAVPAATTRAAMIDIARGAL